jgi:phosphoribosyl 1,2-cyclic phosphodiesterase
MLEFNPIASGSSGNCYILDDGSTQIMIEAGIPWKRVKMAMDFKTSSISACCPTHQHSDHSGYLKDVAKAGIDIYLMPETRQALGLEGHRYHDIELFKTFRVGTFQIKAFDLRHDVPNCGFLFASDAGEKALYITDSFYCKHRFPPVEIIAIECNYSTETMAPDLNPTRKERLYTSHFSLENVKRFLAANDLSKVREIWAIHISKENGCPEYFKEELQKATGKPVYTL